MTQEFEFRLHIKGPDTSQVFPVPIGVTTVGRQTGNDLQLSHPQVSRQHARFDCTADECQITDLGSANGTRVNGEKLTPNVPVTLAANAAVKIGPFEITCEHVPVKVKAQVPAAEMPAKKPPKVKEAPPPAKKPTAKAQPKPVEPPAEPEPEVKPLIKAVKKPPLPPKAPPPAPTAEEEGPVVPGLSIHSRRLLDYLPGIYHTDFMARFLALFESILVPIEWNVDGFDLYLSPVTAPTDFLPWLANWFQIVFDSTWSEAQRRTLLAEAHQIYARRGTRWALSRVIEIYTGQPPEIVDLGKDQDPFTFTVRLPMRKRDVNQELVEAIIDANKPAHTTYTLKFRR